MMTTTNSTNNKDTAKSNLADLTESCRQKLTELEQDLNKETGEKIALVAYRVN